MTLLAALGIQAALSYVTAQMAAAAAAAAAEAYAIWQKVAGLLNGIGGPSEVPVSPDISPDQLLGKTPAEIDQIARSLGLDPWGPDPMDGRGSYIDPVTGEQRILIHPNEDPPNFHVNDPSGNRLDIHGNVVPDPRDPAAHLPLRPE